MSGRVLDTAGTPVPGVALTFYRFPNGSRAVTDAAGSYDVRVDPGIDGINVIAEKAGYETTDQYILVRSAGDVTYDVRLHAIVRVAAGGSLDLALESDDPHCGFDAEYLCRTVRITAAVPGTVTVTVVPGRPAASLGVALTSDVTPTPSPRLSFRVAGNSETRISILMSFPYTTPAPFTVQTSLEP